MARKKCKKEGGPMPSPGWLTTYGDLTTLLLTFFVFTFTTATINGDEFRLVLTAFRGSLGMLSGGMTLSKGKLEEMGMMIETLPAQVAGKKLAKALKKAESLFKPEIQAKTVRVEENERGIVITLMNDAYFPVGSADIVFDSTKRLLAKIAQLLLSVDNYVRVEGHTDNTPINKGPYNSNWELSSQRAVNVVKYMMNSVKGNTSEYQNLGKRLSATGYAEFRPLPGNNNRTPEERAQNRRVEIIILWNELAQ